VLGRPGLRKFIVAVRHANGEWPRGAQLELERSRLFYDQGTHEMCQGRDEDWIIQYLIPRKVRTKRRNYFRESVNA
jgi:hypothetical protein